MNNKRLILTVALLLSGVLPPCSARALEGTDTAPGTPCSIEKAMTMTANPAGVGGYIMSCEGGQWVAQITASTPTQPDQVATKKYVDDQVATIETHTYTNPRLYTSTGSSNPVLLTFLNNGSKAIAAATLCSYYSGGAYVQGKFISLRPIYAGYTSESATGTAYYCENSCITGLSGSEYAWISINDITGFPGLYWNSAGPAWAFAYNAPEVTTKICSSFDAGGDGTITINGECMAGATATRANHSGESDPSYYWGGYVVEELLCWAN